MAHRKNRRRRRQRRTDALMPIGAAAAATVPQSTLRMLGCDSDTCQETVVLRPEELAIAREKWPVVWIDVEGFGDAESIRMIGDGMNSPSRDSLVRIHDVRNDLMTLRRALWPTRDVLHALGREPTPFVGDHARTHFRDCYDHTMELLDLMESYREIGADLRDIYLASLNNRMNDVMKVLTVIATIFMPLTFITGYYGMNFDTNSPWNMPLLRFRYGGLCAAAIMVATTVGMVVVFWRRGWLKRWH
jgi:hypothetical protein